MKTMVAAPLPEAGVRPPPASPPTTRARPATPWLDPRGAGTAAYENDADGATGGPRDPGTTKLPGVIGAVSRMLVRSATTGIDV